MCACRYFRLTVILMTAMMYSGVRGDSTVYGQKGVEKKKPAAEQQDRPERQVQIFRLQYLHPDVAAGMVNDIWRDNDLRIASDVSSNSVILSADEKMLKEVQALLLRLDVAPDESISRPEPDTHDVMIRVVWLVDERLIEDEGKAAAIPPDLLPTVDKLREKFGLGTLATAGQIVIGKRIADEQDFEGSGTAAVQGTSEFQVQGVVKITAPNKAELNVHVQTGPVRIVETSGSKQTAFGASGASTRKFKKPMCELESKIGVTIGYPVFFGIAPIESKTSLFVVQVLEAHSVMEELTK